MYDSHWMAQILSFLVIAETKGQRRSFHSSTKWRKRTKREKRKREKI